MRTKTMVAKTTLLAFFLCTILDQATTLVARTNTPRPAPLESAFAGDGDVSPAALKPLEMPLRDLDPVELLGADLPELIGKPPSGIVAFRFDAAWRQIPVQIDERKKDSLARIRGRTGRGRDVTALVYADPGTVTGPDLDTAFDADDELVFMFRDAGNRAPKGDPDGVQPGSRLELRISDAVTGQHRYVYLFISDRTLSSDAGQDYVHYNFHLLSGDVCGKGPNPENSFVTTSRYRNHFSDRWVHDGTEILVDGAPGVNILDRDKFQFRPGICSRTTDTFSRGAGAFIANIDGPVRAIRSVIGANSGALTQRDWICYEGRMAVRTYLRVHPIRGTWWFYDFSPAARGMVYYDNLNPEGKTVDGQPDQAQTGRLQWQFITGSQGSLTMTWLIDTNIPDIQHDSYYFDDVKPSWSQCTGDPFAYAASGPATGGLPNTDGGSSNFLSMTRVVHYDGPNGGLERARGRITAAQSPLLVENTADKDL